MHIVKCEQINLLKGKIESNITNTQLPIMQYVYNEKH